MRGTRAVAFAATLLMVVGIQALGSSIASAWTAPTPVAGQINGGGTALQIKTDEVLQAVRNDGSSAAVWIATPPGSTQIRTHLIKRSGALSGAETTVATIPNPGLLSDLEVAPLGNGYVFLWAEFYSAANNFTELRYRTLSSSGALGPIVSLGSSSVPSSQGLALYSGLSASAGGGFTNLSWGFRSRTGAPANGCAGEFYLGTAGPCTLTQKATFVRLRSDGSIAKGPIDLIDRQFTSGSTACYWSVPVDLFTNTVPSSGAATVVMGDNCRPQGGELTQVLLFSRISAKGRVSPAQILAPEAVEKTSMAGDGTTIVSSYDRIFRIPPKGRASGPIIVTGTVGKGWNVVWQEAVALPNGQAMTVMYAFKTSGSKLVKGVWGRLVRANGSLGKPKLLFSRTLTGSGPGTPNFSYIEMEAASGLGKDTTTLTLAFVRGGSQSTTEASRTLQVFAMGINGKGAKVKGSQAMLASESLSWNPSTEYVSAYSVEALDVSRNGTASALSLMHSSKELAGPPFTGSAQVSLFSSKLLRNPRSCGVTPSRC